MKTTNRVPLPVIALIQAFSPDEDAFGILHISLAIHAVEPKGHAHAGLIRAIHAG